MWKILTLCGSGRTVNRLDRRTDQVTRYNQPVFRRGVRAIAKHRRGNLWLGTNGNGLVRFDPRSATYKLTLTRHLILGR
jgi:streptogramin lyase